MTVALWLNAVFDDPPSREMRPRSSLEDRTPKGSETTDAMVIAAVQRGDRAVFDIWYGAHFDALWKFAFRFTKNQDAAKDIVQDVFVSFWMRPEAFAPQGPLRAYLYGAVRNRALHVLRQSSTADRFAGTLRGTDLDVSDATSEAVSPDTLIEARELHAQLAALIESLPERQRTALILHVEHDMTASEIARTLGVSATAATNLLQRGLQNLRRSLTRSSEKG